MHLGRCRGDGQAPLPEQGTLSGIENEPLADICEEQATLFREGQFGIVDLVVFTALFAIGITAFRLFSSNTDGRAVAVIILIGGLVGVSFLLAVATRLLQTALLCRRTVGLVCEHRRIPGSPYVEIIARYRVEADVYQASRKMRDSVAFARWPVGGRVTIGFSPSRPHRGYLQDKATRGRGAILALATVLLALAIFAATQMLGPN